MVPCSSKIGVFLHLPKRSILIQFANAPRDTTVLRQRRLQRISHHCKTCRGTRWRLVKPLCQPLKGCGTIKIIRIHDDQRTVDMGRSGQYGVTGSPRLRSVREGPCALRQFIKTLKNKIDLELFKPMRTEFLSELRFDLGTNN